MKFDVLVENAFQGLQEQDPSMDMNTPAPGPETAPTQVPQVTKLTPEGKRFMIELALKALAFDPNNMADQDKAIFDEEITPENAEQILQRIEQITTGTGVEPASTEDDDDGI